jgi:hypothetical protein
MGGSPRQQMWERATGRSAPWSWGRPDPAAARRARSAAPGPRQDAPARSWPPQARCAPDAAGPTPPCACCTLAIPGPTPTATPAWLACALRLLRGHGVHQDGIDVAAGGQLVESVHRQQARCPLRSPRLNNHRGRWSSPFGAVTIGLLVPRMASPGPQLARSDKVPTQLYRRDCALHGGTHHERGAYRTIQRGGAGCAVGPTARVVRSRAACRARRVAAGSDRSARAVSTGRIRKLGCSTQVGI